MPSSELHSSRAARIERAQETVYVERCMLNWTRDDSDSPRRRGPTTVVSEVPATPPSARQSLFDGKRLFLTFFSVSRLLGVGR